MWLAIDIGGTKTLIAAFDVHGNAKKELKFPTPQNYDEFLKELALHIPELGIEDFKSAGVAVPGILDRERGRVLALGNLSWKNEPIEADLERLCGCPVIIENDAKLAGLYEAKNVMKDFKRVVYITISTGIGIALIVNGVIDSNVGDRGGKGILLEHEGKIMPWENFASGKAIVKKYGKRASDITDIQDWKEIVRTFSIGILDVTAVLEPQIVIIGGGVGAHFDKFGKLLVEESKKYETPMEPIPPIIGAKRPEEAVIYGCYELAKDTYGHTLKTA